jgi:two-component system, NarL family, sensor histidine kinase UhpB
MQLLRPHTWGITGRLVMVATIPALLMFAAISIALYVVGRDSAMGAVREHGDLVAAALAETSQFGVVSGDTTTLERNMRRLLKADPGIVSIEIQDARRKPIALVRAEQASEAFETFVRPITSEVFELEMLDNQPLPASGATGNSTRLREGPRIGYVEVGMTAGPALHDQTRRLGYGALAVLAAALAATAIGLALAQRSLQAPLADVMVALRTMKQGNYDIAIAPRARGELGELQSALVEMAYALNVRRTELRKQVDERTQQLQQSVEQNAKADSERRRLIAQGNMQLEEERRRIAVEIHDHLNASIIGIRSKAEHIAELASGSDYPRSADAIERTATDITRTMSRLYDSARSLVKQLRPEVIDVLGLTGALQEMVNEYNKLLPNIEFVLRVADEFPDLRGQIAITAYRLVQEALSNVIKHSQASMATIRLECPSSHRAVLIRVRDNGVGFDAQTQPTRSLGLIGMRERVAAVGGSMRIESVASKGTSIVFMLPLLAEPESPPDFEATSRPVPF